MHWTALRPQRDQDNHFQNAFPIWDSRVSRDHSELTGWELVPQNVWGSQGQDGQATRLNKYEQEQCLFKFKMVNLQDWVNMSNELKKIKFLNFSLSASRQNDELNWLIWKLRCVNVCTYVRIVFGLLITCTPDRGTRWSCTAVARRTRTWATRWRRRSRLKQENKHYQVLPHILLRRNKHTNDISLRHKKHMRVCVHFYSIRIIWGIHRFSTWQLCRQMHTTAWR